MNKKKYIVAHCEESGTYYVLAIGSGLGLVVGTAGDKAAAESLCELWNEVQEGRVNFKREGFSRVKSDKPAQKFELLKIYEAYPRKIGKSPGLLKLATKIHTQEDFDACLNAAVFFAQTCRQEGTEEQFIPHFQTWVNQERWKDVPMKGVISPPKEVVIDEEKLAGFFDR